MRNPSLSRGLRKPAGWLLAAGVALVLWGTLRNALRPGPEPASQADAVPDLLLVERGIVESADAEPVRMGASGEILEIHPNGTRVQAGAPVLRVDDTDILSSLDDDDLNIQLEELEETIRQARREQVLVEQTNRLTLVAAQLELAREEGAALRTGLSSQDRRMLEIEQRLAELDWIDAREEAARQRNMHERGFIADAVLDRFLRREATAHAALEEKKLQIELQSRGTREEDLVENARTVERYAAELERGESALKRRLDRIDSDIAAGRLRLAQHKFNQARNTEDLERTVTLAATNGIFRVRMYSDWRTGGSWLPYTAGVRKGRFDTVADIVRQSEFRVDLMVHESDVHRVRPGAPVRLRVGAFPDRVFEARITAVGGIGRDRQDVAPRGYEDAPAGVTMFNVEARFDNPDAVDLRPGMSAIAEIRLGAQAGTE